MWGIVYVCMGVCMYVWWTIQRTSKVQTRRCGGRVVYMIYSVVLEKRAGMEDDYICENRIEGLSFSIDRVRVLGVGPDSQACHLHVEYMPRPDSTFRYRLARLTLSGCVIAPVEYGMYRE